MLIIGSHVGFNSKDGLLGSVKEALSYQANTFMFYTGAPQNTIRKEIDDKTTKEAHVLMQENNINIQNVICHAPYIINLANRKDEQKWHFSIDFLKGELKRCDLLGIKYLVLHPGSAVGLPKEEALQNIKDGLNEVLKDNFNCLILSVFLHLIYYSPFFNIDYYIQKRRKVNDWLNCFPLNFVSLTFLLHDITFHLLLLMTYLLLEKVCHSESLDFYF